MKLPLLRSANPERPVMWSQGRPVTARELMQKVVAVSRALPDGRNLINLCEHRDSFLIACCAALVRGHTNLLPSTRAETVVEEVAAMNAGSYRCDDEFVRAACENAAADRATMDAYCAFELPGDHVAVKASRQKLFGAHRHALPQPDASRHAFTQLRNQHPRSSADER